MESVYHSRRRLLVNKVEFCLKIVLSFRPGTYCVMYYFYLGKCNISLNIFWTCISRFFSFLFSGIVNYCDRYAASALKVSETFKPPPLYDIPTSEKLYEYFSQHIPLEKMEQRRKWRDECLAKLAKLKKELPKWTCLVLHICSILDAVGCIESVFTWNNLHIYFF